MSKLNKLVKVIYDRRHEFSNENYFDAFDSNEVKYNNHDFEIIRETEQVTFVDDSLSNNINSTWFSLEKLYKQKNVILLMTYNNECGLKGYKALLDVIKEKVKVIVCLSNEHINEIHELFSQHVTTIIRSTNIEEAVNYCKSVSKKKILSYLVPVILQKNFHAHNWEINLNH